MRGGGVAGGFFSVAMLREGENEEKRQGRSVFLKQNLQHYMARRLKFTEPSLKLSLEIMNLKFTIITANLICSSCGILYILMPWKMVFD